MTPTAAAVAALVGSPLIAGGTALALRRRLHAVLWELCVFEHRARFWVRACIAELVIGVGVAASIGASTSLDSVNAVAAIATVLRWQLAGAITGLLVIAVIVLQQSRRFDAYPVSDSNR
ncbi:MAG: hypothetical protein JOY80_08165 [Candidatus Dormibacteraeota bacterium]|nr:hypothetical protein [Candidatus Dormibacteraeota bacterium]